MSRSRSRGRPAALAAALLTALSLHVVAPASLAQDTASDEEPVDLEAIRADRKAVQLRDRVRPRVSRYLSTAADELDEGNPEEAIRLLHRIRESRLNDLESAFVLRMLAYMHYSADEPEKAIEYFQQALEREALPLDDENRIRYNVAQLKMGVEDWDGAIDWFREWLRYTEQTDPQGYYLMAIAYYQLDEFDAAIEHAKKAIASAEKPQESWLRILSALYSQQQDYAKAAPVLEELLLRYPKKQYWVQLSLIYAALEDYDTSLAVQQVAHQQGFLTEDQELTRLARSYLYNDLPYPAARVLEKGLEEGTIEPEPENYEMLANSWIAAREYDRSLPPLRKAAQLSEDGNLNVRLGQVFMQRERWGEATEMLERALEKGGIENPGAVELLLGIAYYNADRLALARRHFVRARQHEPTRTEADKWITHLANEAGQDAYGAG